MIDVKKLKTAALGIDLLYVDSNVVLLKNASALLKKFFTNVYSANDAVSGLELFKRHNPKIVVIDIETPRMGGITLTKEINRLCPKTRVIIISAHNDKEYLLEYIESNIFKFLQKPVNVGVLTGTLFSAVKEIKAEKNKQFFEENINHSAGNKNSLVLMMDAGKPILANESFLNFFDSKEIGEFNNKYKNITSLFMEQEGFLYNKDGKDAFAEINQKEIYNVKIADKAGEPNHFILKYKRVPEGQTQFIISLENITSLNLMHLYNEKVDGKKKDQEKKDMINLLEVLKQNGANVQLHNYYKGLSITNNALILEVSDSNIVLKTSEMQLKATKYEAKTIIVSDTLPHSMLCEDIAQIDFSNQKVIFNEFFFIPTSPITRKSIRVEPEGQYSIALFINEHQFKGEIRIEDISIDALKLKLDALPAGIKKRSNDVHIEIALAKESEALSINANAEYLRDEENEDSYSVVFLLKFEANQKSNLIKYIAKRQMGLIREFKGM